MKKFVSVILVFAILIVTTMLPASANGPILGDLTTDVQIQGLTELNVRILVSRYFSQRKAYLQGTADTINAAVAPMVTDEMAHKAVLTEANITLTDSTVIINTIAIGDYIADVTATETATFLLNGVTTQESIIHKIYIYKSSEGYLCVSSDGYIESTTNFASASYVSESAMTHSVIDNNTNAGPCIVSVAENEVGYTEGPNGYTKYGAWYDSLHGTTCFAYDAWCVCFVSWCANQANVPTTVIPVSAYAPYLASAFRGLGRYYYSSALGGTYTPQAGDIIFMYGTYNEPGHVGLVRYVSGDTVYIVDGNFATSDAVLYHTRSLTSTDIVAYANPNYPSNTHTVEDLWFYNEFEHWQFCSSCHTRFSSRHELMVIDVGIYGCITCGYIPED